jgi:hypothetical protein
LPVGRITARRQHATPGRAARGAKARTRAISSNRERLDHVIVGSDRETAHPSLLRRAVSMITGRLLVVSRARIRRQISSPETPGSIQSRMTRSGMVSLNLISASSPRSTLSTVKPSASRL